MKHKVYYIHLLNDYSGSPRVLCDAINSGLAEKDDSYVLSSQHSGFLNDANAQHVKFNYKRVNSKYLQLLHFFIAQISLFYKLSALLIKNKSRDNRSLVIINTMLPFSAAIAARLFADKLVYYVHETKLEPLVFKRFLRFFIEKLASEVIFVSHFLQKEEPFERPRQHVIHNGLRSDFLIPKDLNLLSKHEKKQILFAGSLKSYKGIDELIEIARRVENNVIGALNCDQSELDDFSLSKGNLPDNLTLIARPENLQALYKESFLVLNLSRPDSWVETFGLSLLEGMAFGCPVVAPPVGGPTEFVNTTNGILTNGTNYDEIICFIEDISNSFEVWSSMSNSAIVTSLSFTTDKFQSNFKKYFKHIMGEN